MRRPVVLISAVAVVALGLGIGIPVALSGNGSATHHSTPPSPPVAAGSRIAARLGSAYELVAAHPGSPATAGNPSSLAAAEQAFTLDLIKQLSGSSNSTVSPAGLDVVLSMLAQGASGSTLREIQKTTQTTGMSPAQEGAAWAAVTKAWDDPADPAQVQSANSIWDQQGFRPSAGFLAALQKYYASGVWQADFSQDSAGAVQAINDWVSQHTHGKIPTLFDSLPPDTQAVLANALYFKAKWQFPFDPQNTDTAPFTAPSGSVPTPFMTSTMTVPVARTSDYTAVQLPYRGGHFAALAVMPRSGSLTDFVQGLSPADLTTLTGSLHRATVALRLPKFTTTASLDLRPTLEKLGMTTAFTDAADFGAMSKQSLKISDVVQKDYLSVGEKGTTAAAATGAVMVPTVARAAAPTVSFDHPFLFLIRDTTTGAILFASQLQNPAAK